MLVVSIYIEWIWYLKGNWIYKAWSLVLEFCRLLIEVSPFTIFMLPLCLEICGSTMLTRLLLKVVLIVGLAFIIIFLISEITISLY